VAVAGRESVHWVHLGYVKILVSESGMFDMILIFSFGAYIVRDVRMKRTFSVKGGFHAVVISVMEDLGKCWGMIPLDSYSFQSLIRKFVRFVEIAALMSPWIGDRLIVNSLS